jgi:ABC-type nitrate/sulfonate/bicarbonate transport system ATPase subunit
LPDGRALRLRVAGVAYTYEGRRLTRALDGMTLDVCDNEFVAIVGPVGCGKTTLLRIVAGFLRPAKGAVLCDGAPVTAPGRERGYVFQEDAIFPWMTVQENLEFGLLAKGLGATARAAITRELIGLIGLQGFERAYPKELSAGMAKMVEVARVLATHPAILLLDEPFGALDAQTRMQAELSALWEKRKKTVLWSPTTWTRRSRSPIASSSSPPRPARVKADLEIDLARPRTLETRLSPAFAAINAPSGASWA